jgi:DNA recombination protein RmuC
MEDTGRLRERVLDLQRHFGQANADIEKIITSSERIAARGRKIEGLEFEDAAPAATIEHHMNGAVSPSPASPRGEPSSPQRGVGEMRPQGTERPRNGGSANQPDLLAGK